MGTLYNTDPNFIFLLLVSLTLLSFHSHSTVCSTLVYEEGYETNFSYDERTGRGPSRWGQLDPNWYLCSNGTRQSPIAISDSRVQLRPGLGDLQKDYKPAPATLYNKGHDIQVGWNGDAGKITVNGNDYKVLQCHWHTPSEHKFDGVRFAMELHLVHQNSLGQIAVVGFVYRYGPPDPFLSKLYKQIRALQNGSREIPLGNVNPGDIYDEYDIFRSKKYYRYSGSLTTPPCSEDVIWTLMKKVKTASFEQVQALKEAVDEGYEENARPIQPLNGRSVYLYSKHYITSYALNKLKSSS